MMFKRLKYTIPEQGIPTFIPVGGPLFEPVERDIALIKATTMLTFLYDNNALHTAYLHDERGDQWVVYSREPNVTSVDVLKNADLSAVDLLIATNQSSLLTRQYGIAIVRDTLEYRTTFAHEFMQSTRSWLENHSDEVENLKAFLYHRHAS